MLLPTSVLFLVDIWLETNSVLEIKWRWVGILIKYSDKCVCKCMNGLNFPAFIVDCLLTWMQTKLWFPDNSHGVVRQRTSSNRGNHWGNNVDWASTTAIVWCYIWYVIDMKLITIHLSLLGSSVTKCRCCFFVPGRHLNHIAIMSSKIWIWKCRLQHDSLDVSIVQFLFVFLFITILRWSRLLLNGTSDCAVCSSIKHERFFVTPGRWRVHRSIYRQIGPLYISNCENYFLNCTIITQFCLWTFLPN